MQILPVHFQVSDGVLFNRNICSLRNAFTISLVCSKFLRNDEHSQNLLALKKLIFFSLLLGGTQQMTQIYQEYIFIFFHIKIKKHISYVQKFKVPNNNFYTFIIVPVLNIHRHLRNFTC